MQTVRSLEPKAVWNHFEDLNAVPRPSKKEERIRAFMVRFGQSLNLQTEEDEIGNVLIRKPGQGKLANRPTVVMQAHLDMVHQKNNDTVFDFNTQGIESYVDGDWVKAKGTTLGADNGMGVAYIMALLSSTGLDHPPLEALFTIDEETGMTGAIKLKENWLTGKVLLNIDTEDDTELTIGCAGGVDVTATATYQPVAIPSGYKGIKLGIKGLTGGHSGMDIHLGRGNANKLLIRVLNRLAEDFSFMLHAFDGGSLRNAIPREAEAVVAIPEASLSGFLNLAHQELNDIRTEHKTTDPQFTLVAEEVAVPKNGMPVNFQKKMLHALYTVWNGIYRMSPDIADLVQTSNNLARVLAGNGEFTAMCLTRSAVDTEKMDLARTLRASFQLMDCEVSFTGSYPGWAPNPESNLVKQMEKVFVEVFGDQPYVNACHAGLECGIIGEHYPGMEMISFGPNIRGAHSPDERVQISSVQKSWKLLLETLNRL